MHKPIEELEWLKEELVKPTHNLKLEDLLPRLAKIKEMKDDCREVFSTPQPPEDKERDDYLSGRLSHYLSGVEESKKFGQEGSLVPADFGSVLSQAMNVVLTRLVD